MPAGAAAELAAARARYLAGTSREREIENLKQGLWAIRSTYESSEYRLYFGIRKDKAVVLAVLATGKKTKKAPKKDTDLARRRLRSWRPPEGASSGQLAGPGI